MSDLEHSSCLSGPRVMEDFVFSCRGLMRLSRVLRPYKQNPLAEKMPRYPTPPNQEIWLDKKQTQVQALASRPHCILHQSTKHKVVRKRWHFSCISPQISHTNKKRSSRIIWEIAWMRMFTQVCLGQMTLIWKYFVLVIEFCSGKSHGNAGVLLICYCFCLEF